MNSYVYLITDGNLTKIGISDNPKSRLKNLQTSNPKQLSIFHVFTCHDRVASQQLESLLHSRYAEIRVSGEWFNIRPDAILSDVSWAVQITETMCHIEITQEVIVQTKEEIKSYGITKHLARLILSLKESSALLKGIYRYRIPLIGNPVPSKLELAKEWLRVHPDDMKLTSRELSSNCKPHGVLISHAYWNKAKTEV